MVDFETYSNIIKYKVFLEKRENEIRKEYDSVKNDLSCIIGQYMYSITLHLPFSTLLSVSLMKDYKECVDILEKILDIIHDSQKELQSVIDNHYDLNDFVEFLDHFEEKIKILNELL